MKPISFDHATDVLRAPAGMPECGDLPIYRHEDLCVSCWQPTEEERAAIAAGLPVWLTVTGGMPPVSLATVSPFGKQPAPPEPEAKAALRRIGDAIKWRLPAGSGFLLLTFPLGRTGRLDYIANGDRRDCIAMLKEFLIKCGAAEDWMKKIE